MMLAVSTTKSLLTEEKSMPPEASGSNSLSEWIRFAQADLAYASIPLPAGVMFEQLCFHAQQAVEQAIKSVLIFHGIPFPKTHSIARLIDLLPTTIPRNKELLDAIELTDYATSSRYPGEETVSEEEYQDVIMRATLVVSWAIQYLHTHSVPESENPA